MILMMLWFGLGLLGLLVEIVMYRTGHHRDPEGVREVLGTPHLLLILGALTILSGPIQLATLAATWRREES